LNFQASAEITPAIRRWKAYPIYKDSAVEWLGRVPAQWEVKRIKRLCLVKRGASPRPIEDPIYFDDDGEYSWVRISDVTASTKYLERTEQRLSEHGKSKSVPLEPGELFLSIAATVGKPIITKIKCCIHDGFVYFVGLKENREYLFYLFSSGELYKGIGKTGTQLNLNTDTIGDLRIPLPSSPEQEVIVAFLDRETAKIDTLVAKKERLIELLQEKRAALISRAVTKGLDPNVPMKDSGIEWLGEIPADWEVRPLSYALKRITYGFTNPMPVDDEGPFLLTANDIGDGEIMYSTARRTTLTAYQNELTDKSRPRTGDILVTKDGTLGRVAVANGTQVCINQSVALLRVDDSVALIDFVQNALRASSYQDRMVFEAGGTTIKHIYISRLAKMPFAFPSRREQEVIAGFVNAKGDRLKALIAKIREGIEKLKEYRTALISAAVTGKIDVREENSL
jgi:type I restriction enzyme S subunit